MLTICSQLRCIDSRRVNAVAASRAVCVAIITVTSVSIAVAIASPLALETWRNRLVFALDSSKDEYSACGLDRRALRYVDVNTTCADLFPSNGRLGRRDFARVR